jgi:hypothetical protein
MGYLAPVLFIIFVFVISIPKNNIEENSAFGLSGKEEFHHGIEGNHTFVFVQSFVRDSQDHLIAYLKTDQFTYVNEQMLQKFLDLQAVPDDPIIKINGQMYQVIIRQHVTTYYADDVIAKNKLVYSFGNGNATIMEFTHDGFPVESGDKQITVWTFIRPSY